MSHFDFDLNPVENIIADAEGPPGKRTFFIQGRSGKALISVILEKQEVANLAISLLKMLEELADKFPDISPTSKPDRELKPDFPIDPAFRVGQIILGYDEDDDAIWLIAKAIHVTPDGDIADFDDEEVDIPTVRFVATRTQMRALSEHALEVISRGRPVCPLCNRSIDSEGHFCPRTDGHAVPIVF